MKRKQNYPASLSSTKEFTIQSQWCLLFFLLTIFCKVHELVLALKKLGRFFKLNLWHLKRDKIVIRLIYSRWD